MENTNNVKNNLLEYLRLLRFQTSAATASAPLIGGLIAGQREIIPLFILLILGILFHIYGFVLNEYIDIEVDKKSRELHKKPLVSGSIPVKHAGFIVILSCIFAFGLTVIFFPTILTIIFFIISLLLGGIYDVFGKKIIGSDFILGLGFFFACLFGVSTYSSDFTTIIYIVSLAYFLHIVFNNAVEGGLKDVYHDSLAGAKTTATRLGVKVKEGKLLVTKKFAGFAYILRIIFIALVFSLIYVQNSSQWFNDYLIQISIFIILMVIIFFSMFKFLQNKVFDRSRLKKLFSLHEMASYFMLIIGISPIIGLEITLFLMLLPFAWYLVFNGILYGKLLQPQV
jgi:4-hydroxybenzoate polyprenyltransferase